MTTKEIQTISRSNTRETIYKRIPNDESNYITHYMYTQHTFQMPWFTPQTYFHQLEHIDSTRASKYITRQPIPFTVLITSVRRRLNFPRYSNHTHFTLSQFLFHDHFQRTYPTLFAFSHWKSSLSWRTHSRGDRRNSRFQTDWLVAVAAGTATRRLVTHRTQVRFYLLATDPIVVDHSHPRQRRDILRLSARRNVYKARWIPTDKGNRLRKTFQSDRDRVTWIGTRRHSIAYRSFVELWMPTETWVSPSSSSFLFFPFSLSLSLSRFFDLTQEMETEEFCFPKEEKGFISIHLPRDFLFDPFSGTCISVSF